MTESPLSPKCWPQSTAPHADAGGEQSRIGSMDEAASALPLFSLAGEVQGAVVQDAHRAIIREGGSATGGYLSTGGRSERQRMRCCGGRFSAAFRNLRVVVSSSWSHGVPKITTGVKRRASGPARGGM